MYGTDDEDLTPRVRSFSQASDLAGSQGIRAHRAVKSSFTKRPSLLMFSLLLYTIYIYMVL